MRSAFDRYPPTRLLAKLAAAFALGCLVAVILSGGGSPAKASATSGSGGGAPAQPSATLGSGGGPRATASAAAAHPSAADTPAGAATAATAWCQLTADAFVAGRWDSAVSALATGAFQALALRYQAASALVHQRLTAAATPYALRVWPLGYTVERYASTSARVRVWQLYILAATGPERDTEFTTTTVELEWTSRGWRVTAAPPGADLAPPGGNATRGAVATWVRAANKLESYAYVP